MQRVEKRLLGVYLNDHLAGAVAGEELAKRCLSRNREPPLGTFLSRLVSDVHDDRETLERLMGQLGVALDPWKRSASWALEKIGRLKLNGGHVVYSDLSRLEELESLCLGVEGKACMWRALGSFLSEAPEAHGFDFTQLESRATSQREQLEEHRLEAAARLLRR
jgi:hypothetical protein